MKRKNQRYFLLVVLVGALLLTGFAAAASPTPAIDWNVIGGGGGHTESPDGSLSIDGTFGQPVAGIAGPGLCTGFWCGLADWVAKLHLYLPVILAN